MNPKVAVIENVKGILSSNDGQIIKEILISFQERGYKADYKLLDASDYGVPQARQRVVIIANRINQANIFPEKHNNKIPVGAVLENIPENVENHEKRYLTGKTLERVKLIKPGQNWTFLPEDLQTKSVHSGAYGRIDPTKPSKTLTTRFDTPSVGYVTHPTEHRTLTVREGARIQTFPDSFVFTGARMKQYKQVGNAVPVKLGYELSKGIKKMLDNS
jgi:DNA-cytosine methyltransferase